ncbi:hypothetical protein SAMN05892877_103238 [Rhizobium subbaraonis]|uniref:Uncharacterized protein n=1 Tax=Rhizobium subbaraonis TaxID=908946 RepID=A0A285U4Z2_9HYPH|nr:hypothetical protein [Rhizobium subbaraonis]SOC36899.1 hypothetical protein SAMN05892877_103238 [Rhizobium subbaraonis]
MARTPEEWGALLGSTLAKMQASDPRFMLPAMSPDCCRIITETIAVIAAEARSQGYDDALLGMQGQMAGRNRLHA